MSEIVKHTGGGGVGEKVDWAKFLASSNLLPRHYQQQPANLLLAAEYADALGVPRINAVTGIHVISGKPTMSADLMAGLVRKAGHKLRVTADDKKARAVLIRADDPDFEFVSEWTLDKAKQAQLTGNANWKKFPKAMLRSRAISEVIKDGASECLHGLIYTPEELGAQVDADGEPVQVTVEREPEPAPPVAEPVRMSLPKPDPAPEPEPEHDLDTGIFETTRKTLFALFTKKGVVEKERQLAAVKHYTGVEISSRQQITENMAQIVITGLQALADAPAEPAEDVPVEAEIIEEEPTTESEENDS